MSDQQFQVIEMIRRIVADDTADLRAAVQRLQHQSTATVYDEPYEETSVLPDIKENPEQAAVEAARGDEYYERLEAIKALHSLRANPVTWTRDNTGKMVEAPEGLWEVECSACNHKVVWREGQSKPPQCQTWLIADGQTEG